MSVQPQTAVRPSSHCMGRSFSRRETMLGRWRRPAAACVGLLAFTITVIPILVGTFMTAFEFFDILRPWTLANWQRNLVVGAGSALIGVMVYTIVAYVVVKTRVPGRGLLDLLLWLPWAIPGVLVGLAIL